MFGISIEEFSTIATIFLTLILVVITAYYACATGKYLKEFRNDRKVRLILERLEKFYSPYLQNQSTIDLYPYFLSTGNNNLDSANEIFKEIRLHSYLTTDVIRKDIEEYFLMVREDGIKKSERGKDFEKLREKVNMSVKEDYERLIKELEGLTSNRQLFKSLRNLY